MDGYLLFKVNNATVRSIIVCPCYHGALVSEVLFHTHEAESIKIRDKNDRVLAHFCSWGKNLSTDMGETTRSDHKK